MTCKDCIHDGVCHLQEMTNGLEIEEYIREFGCEDFKNKADFAEVRHGHWIKSGNEKKCSVCGFVYYSNNDEWNGCPNCLARMYERRDT